MLEIIPVDKLDAQVRIPGSKSYTNRALPIAALAAGKSILRSPLKSDDTKYMRQALQAIGVEIEEQKETFVVHGTHGKFTTATQDLYVGASGTSMRFLTALAALVPGKTVLTGTERMQARPQHDLLDGLRQLGVNAASAKEDYCPPVVVNGPLFPGGTCQMRGDVSSQYFSAILLSAPYAQQDVIIEVLKEQTSKPYIDMTIDIMQSFGVEVENDNYQQYTIPSGQHYQAREYVIESDATNTTYFMALAAITGGKVRLQNINHSSVQGDFRFADVLEQMGCTISRGNDWLELQGTDELRAITANLNAMPDTAQTLAVVAAFAKGTTQIQDVANMRVKETDRIAAMCTELRKIGIEVNERTDGFSIIGGEPHGAEIDTYDDHRMAFAFAVLGARIPGIRIRNPEVIGKTFPTFWHVLNSIGIETKEIL